MRTPPCSTAQRLALVGFATLALLALHGPMPCHAEGVDVAEGANAGRANGGGCQKRTLPDVIVIGEEHGNPAYRRVLLGSLNEFAEAGYLTFASEKPENLQDSVDLYIRSTIALDDQGRRRALWEIAAEAVNRSLPKGTSLFDSHGVPGAEKLEDALGLLVDARLTGFRVLLVDMDSAIISGYLKGGPERSAVANALRSTLEARNKHMAGAISPNTILLVGRAHTGKDRSSVEHFIRGRGLSTVSIDLKGADLGTHPRDSEDADLSASPQEVHNEGGLLPYIKSRLPLPRATPSPLGAQ
jgi:hypothetical protein